MAYTSKRTSSSSKATSKSTSTSSHRQRRRKQATPVRSRLGDDVDVFYDMLYGSPAIHKSTASIRGRAVSTVVKKKKKTAPSSSVSSVKGGVTCRSTGSSRCTRVKSPSPAVSSRQSSARIRRKSPSPAVSSGSAVSSRGSSGRIRRPINRLNL